MRELWPGVRCEVWGARGGCALCRRRRLRAGGEVTGQISEGRGKREGGGQEVRNPGAHLTRCGHEGLGKSRSLCVPASGSGAGLEVFVRWAGGGLSIVHSQAYGRRFRRAGPSGFTSVYVLICTIDLLVSGLLL